MPTIIATGIVSIDRGPDYFQVTFAFDQMFGHREVQETQISGRVVLTPSAWRALQAAIGDDGKAATMPPVH